MKRIIKTLAFMLIVLSSDALIPLIKDGGARNEGSDNLRAYSGLLDSIPSIWLAAVLLTIIIVFFFKRLKSIEYSKPIILLIIFCFASIFWSDFPKASLRAALLIAGAYIFITIQIDLYGWKTTFRFLCFTILSILIGSMVAILLIPSYGIGVGNHAGKWQGIFTHKNNLGNFAAVSFLMFVWQYHQRKSLASLMAALLALTLAVGSQSGNAIANIALVLLVFGLFSLKLTRIASFKLRYILLLSLVTLSFLAIYISIDSSNIKFFDRDSSFTSRDRIWIYTITKLGTSPLVGFGLDQWSSLTTKNHIGLPENIGFIAASTHHGFLETAFSLGFVGLILVLWVFIDSIKNKSNDAGFRLMFGYLISYIAINTFEARMIGFNFYFILLIYVILISNAISSSKLEVTRKKH